MYLWCGIIFCQVLLKYHLFDLPFTNIQQLADVEPVIRSIKIKEKTSTATNCLVVERFSRNKQVFLSNFQPVHHKVPSQV